MLHYTCLVLLLSAVASYSQQQIPSSSACEGDSCYAGDLLIGREDKLFASSTCGLDDAEPFYIVSNLQTSNRRIFYCDSRTPWQANVNKLNHDIKHVVTSMDNSEKKQRWWQSENGLEQVYIQFDLEAVFHFTHLIMTFKSFRPRAMIIERSSDFGHTWKPYRYFAYDCERSFPQISRQPIRNISQVICESRYSAVEPSTGGEVIFRVLPPNIRIDDPYSREVQDMIKVTNIRINITELHFLGDHLLDDGDEVFNKYYYALYEMVVRGSCHCFNHASRCVPADGMESKLQMVNGQCECIHYTEGKNCERCMPFFNDQPWRPAGLHGETNECKRCNCNDHATSCHFDEAVYQLTNGASGGVCDNCMHNTVGRNCEQCKPFFYMHPDRDIRDPNICVPCNCDPAGSENGGECASHTQGDLVAGMCLCKRYVTGQRCDGCQDGYWELRDDNPEGCRECACNILGSENNMGCDKTTGNCRCKRFVTGQNCDQCYEGYYGLSEDIYGCNQCDCDPGGSYNNSCNQISGQCPCRRNIGERQCAEVNSGYFYVNMDYYTYEAEYARAVGDLSLADNYPRIREEGSYIGWTGPGFMRIHEGGGIEFTVSNLPLSGDYDLILRFEPLLPGDWEDVRISITRPGDIPTQSVCGNTIPQDDLLVTSLPSGSRNVVLGSPVCLESGKTYIIRIDFTSYSSQNQIANAQILLDSLVVMPRSTSYPIFQGPDPIEQYRREQWEYYRCGEAHMSAVHSPLSDVCKELMFSMSALAFDGALACQCDPTGSLSNICDESGGQCECKPNVIGRTCNQCAPGTYGFGPDGCTRCNCDTTGSMNDFCNQLTGQCPCRPNTYGQQCNECQPGFWNFPNCQRCDCNGYADICDSRTGECIDCQSNTAGFNCESCKRGYYGDPTRGSVLPCQACLCPGGDGSGNQFADTCQLDQAQQTVRCDCFSGYTGIRCDQCDNNYFGNPTERRGVCNLCNCNGNTLMSNPGNCDADSGRCTNCLYDTAGFNCEQCAPGYYGDALQRTCRDCECNPLGTDFRRCDLDNNCGVCDHESGQCPCKPNVLGRQCDQCAPDHWKLASDNGCEPCNCCPYGAVSSRCDVYTGQCACRSGFGGRECCDCEENFWGDPRVGCRECDCDAQGSATSQCERATGQCVCLPGVTGYRCDQCARGTTGELPRCEPCGECFDDWDLIVLDLRNQTDDLIERARKIKVTGASGAYDNEFERLEVMVQYAESLIRTPSVTETDVYNIQSELNDIRAAIEKYREQVRSLEEDQTRTRGDIFRARHELDRLEIEVQELMEDALRLRDQSFEVSAADVEGAMNSIEQSQNRSREAESDVANTRPILTASAGVRAEVEGLLGQRTAALESERQDYLDRLDDVENQLTGLEGQLANINEQVCGAPGDSCDICGGAGCGQCGGLSCGGSIQKAEEALRRASEADGKLDKKKEEADSMLTEVMDAKFRTGEALGLAKAAYDEALLAKVEAEGGQTNIKDLINNITDFLGRVKAEPDDVRLIVNDTLSTKISLSPEEIEALSEQIEDIIDTLENIDEIIAATRDDLSRVNDLKARADAARAYAEDVLQSAEGVVRALEQAEAAQDIAEQAIDDATRDIRDAGDAIIQIESEAGNAKDKSEDLLDKIAAMREQLEGVQLKVTDNKVKINEAVNLAQMAEGQANQAAADVAAVEQDFNETSDRVMAKVADVKQAKDRAEILFNSVVTFETKLQSDYNELLAMQQTFNTNEGTLTDLTDEINVLNMKMMTILMDIQTKAAEYRTCKESPVDAP